MAKKLASNKAYSSDDLNAAVEEVKSGKSKKSVAKKYNIPRATLIYRVLGIHTGKSGGTQLLTTEEESFLKDLIIDGEKRSLHLSKDMIKNHVANILIEEKKLNISRKFPKHFKWPMPGDVWFKSFCQRNDIVHREAKQTSDARLNVTKQAIMQWFSSLYSDCIIKEEAGLLDALYDDERIFNIGETRVTLESKAMKDMELSGSRSRNIQCKMSDSDNEPITVLATVRADGAVAPPMVIYKNDHLPSHFKETIVQAIPDKEVVVKASKTGFINSEIVREYITEDFDEWLTLNEVSRPVMLFTGWHSNRFNSSLLDQCKEKNIFLYSLPSGASHIMQPLHVSIFEPLKEKWMGYIDALTSKSKLSLLSKETFGPIFFTLFFESVLPTDIVSGFRKCGLHPFDPRAPDYKKLKNIIVNEENLANVEIEQNGCKNQEIQTKIVKAHKSTQTDKDLHEADFINFNENVETKEEWETLQTREVKKEYIITPLGEGQVTIRQNTDQISPNKIKTTSPKAVTTFKRKPDWIIMSDGQRKRLKDEKET